MESGSMHSEDEKDERGPSKKFKVPVAVIISEGNKYLRVLRFEKAISCFEKILQQNKNNIQALLGRAKCNMRLANYREAWLDFDQVIKLNPKCTEAIYLKGVTEYLRGNFEKGFMTYLHGYQQRPSCDSLRQGYQFCQKAIENNLGNDKRMALTDKDVDTITRLKKKNKFSEDDNENSTSFDKKDLFYSELRLLQDIMKDEKLTPLHSLCKNLFEYLKGRQQFWRMQAPCFTNRSSQFVKNNIYDIIQMNRLVRNFGLCRIALEEGKTDISLQKGKEALKILRSISHDFPERTDLEAETLHNLVMSCLAEENFDTAMKYCEQQLNIIDEHQMQESKRRVISDFGEIYYRTHKYENSLQHFQQSLGLIKCEEEKALILYKIANCSVHLNKLEEAKNVAQKSLDLATRSHDRRLQFDTMLLLAEIAVSSKEMKVAKGYYRHALDLAVQNKDSRQKDLEQLLQEFEDVATKDSSSTERIKIIQESTLAFK